jgi:hypothetical protein
MADPGLSAFSIVTLVAGSSVLAAIVNQSIGAWREMKKGKREAAFSALYPKTSRAPGAHHRVILESKRRRPRPPGCGTAVHAAQKLRRQWIGIDVTHLAISLIEKRLKDAFPGIQFEVHGTPKDLASAQDLALRDKYQFQWWAVSMVDALPFGGKKKGADGGIDGIIYFKPDGKRTEKALVSVKGGGSVSVNMIRDLHSAMAREKAPIGVFITAALPTRPMETEAAAVGRFEDEWGRTYPRLQIITLAELFQGKKPDTFTPDARREATRDGAPAIDLIDGEGLIGLLKKLQLGVKTEQVITERVTVDPSFFDDI